MASNPRSSCNHDTPYFRIYQKLAQVVRNLTDSDHEKLQYGSMALITNQYTTVMSICMNPPPRNRTVAYFSGRRITIRQKNNLKGWFMDGLYS